MSEPLRNLSLDLSKWTRYKTVEPFRVLGIPMLNLRQLCYQTELNGEMISAGVFEYNNKKTHIAWGIKSEPHCSFHALALPNGNWGVPIPGCPEYEVLRHGSTITGFSVDGSIFPTGTHQSQSFMQTTKEKLRQFAPLVIFFVIVLVWASVRTYFAVHAMNTQMALQMEMSRMHGYTFQEWMLDFMGGFFLLFGALKVLGLKKFAAAFGTYDVLASRFKAWGFVYPFIELGLGILYTARLFLPVACILTIVLMLVGSIGIFLKLRKKEEVVCACLGGFFDLPVTGITLGENLLMAGMAFVMLVV